MDGSPFQTQIKTQYDIYLIANLHLMDMDSTIIHYWYDCWLLIPPFLLLHHSVWRMQAWFNSNHQLQSFNKTIHATFLCSHSTSNLRIKSISFVKAILEKMTVSVSPTNTSFSTYQERNYQSITLYQRHSGCSLFPTPILFTKSTTTQSFIHSSHNFKHFPSISLLVAWATRIALKQKEFKISCPPSSAQNHPSRCVYHYNYLHLNI